MTNIGKELHQYRLNHGISRARMGKSLGVGRQHVYNLEMGLSNPSIQLAERIGRRIGIRFVARVENSKLVFVPEKNGKKSAAKRRHA